MLNGSYLCLCVRVCLITNCYLKNNCGLLNREMTISIYREVIEINDSIKLNM